MATVKLTKWWLTSSWSIGAPGYLFALLEILIGNTTAGAVGMLMHINGKFTYENWKYVSGRNFFLNRPLLSISRCMSRYEADLAVFVISFIPSSMGVYMLSLKSWIRPWLFICFDLFVWIFPRYNDNRLHFVCFSFCFCFYFYPFLLISHSAL
jgi:hypothetical protein